MASNSDLLSALMGGGGMTPAASWRKKNRPQKGAFNDMLQFGMGMAMDPLFLASMATGGMAATGLAGKGMNKLLSKLLRTTVNPREMVEGTAFGASRLFEQSPVSPSRAFTREGESALQDVGGGMTGLAPYMTMTEGGPGMNLTTRHPGTPLVQGGSDLTGSLAPGVSPKIDIGSRVIKGMNRMGADLMDDGGPAMRQSQFDVGDTATWLSTIKPDEVFDVNAGPDPRIGGETPRSFWDRLMEDTSWRAEEFQKRGIAFTQEHGVRSARDQAIGIQPIGPKRVPIGKGKYKIVREAEPWAGPATQYGNALPDILSEDTGKSVLKDASKYGIQKEGIATSEFTSYLAAPGGNADKSITYSHKYGEWKLDPKRRKAIVDFILDPTISDADKVKQLAADRGPATIKELKTLAGWLAQSRGRLETQVDEASREVARLSPNAWSNALTPWKSSEYLPSGTINQGEKIVTMNVPSDVNPIPIPGGKRGVARKDMVMNGRGVALQTFEWHTLLNEEEKRRFLDMAAGSRSASQADKSINTMLEASTMSNNVFKSKNPPKAKLPTEQEKIRRQIANTNAKIFELSQQQEAVIATPLDKPKTASQVKEADRLRKLSVEKEKLRALERKAQGNLQKVEGDPGYWPPSGEWDKGYEVPVKQSVTKKAAASAGDDAALVDLIATQDRDIPLIEKELGLLGIPKDTGPRPLEEFAKSHVKLMDAADAYKAAKSGKPIPEKQIIESSPTELLSDYLEDASHTQYNGIAKTAIPIIQQAGADSGGEWNVVRRLYDIRDLPPILRESQVQGMGPGMQKLARDPILADSVLDAVEHVVEQAGGTAKKRSEIRGEALQEWVGRALDFTKGLDRDQRRFIEHHYKDNRPMLDAVHKMWSEHDKIAKAVDDTIARHTGAVSSTDRRELIDFINKAVQVNKPKKVPTKKVRRHRKEFFQEGKFDPLPGTVADIPSGKKISLAELLVANQQILKEDMQVRAAQAVKAQELGKVATDATRKKLIQKQLMTLGYKGMRDGDNVVLFHPNQMKAPNIGFREKPNPQAALLGALAPVGTGARRYQKEKETM